MWKVFTPIICLYFWLFMKCGAMAGELRLGESARILKNTRELLFSRTLSCSVPPCPLYFFLSFSLSHWLLQIPWPSWPTEYMLCTMLHYPNWSCRMGSTSHCLYVVFQNLVLFPDFPSGFKGPAWRGRIFWHHQFIYWHCQMGHCCSIYK